MVLYGPRRDRIIRDPAPQEYKFICLNNSKRGHEMPEAKPLKVVKVICTECGGNARNHDVLREVEVAWEYDEEDDEYCGEEGGSTYQICRCKGCDTVRFRQESWDTINLDDKGDPRYLARFIQKSYLQVDHQLKLMIFPSRLVAFTQKPLLHSTPAP